MDLIDKIRRKNGFGLEMLKRLEADPEITSFREATLENLEQALKNLSEELYSKSTHFVFEFIQNADDNTYATEVDPTLHMRLEDRQASFHCNEVGFTPENVQAICRVGASTKKNMHGYIGEKGIGFKSVFKVADIVFISSGPYTFKLDKREKLGMITPIWADEYPVSTGWTSFYLHLSEDAQELAAHTNDIKPSLLLFLRKLRSLTIEVALSNRPKKTIEIYRNDTDDNNIVHLDRVQDGKCVSSDNYLMIRHVIEAYTQEPKRKNIKESEIVLAFPITKNGEPSISVQDVHAFLPLRKCGFTFIIQADFLTSSSREDILSDLQWNLTLCGGVVNAFLEAVKRFKQHHTLEYIWFRFLPNKISDPFFRNVENDIKRKLRSVPIFRSTDGVYRLAPEVMTIPSRFRDDANQPLIPEDLLWSGMHYLSPAYDLGRDGSRLKDLGVSEMTDDQFIRLLQRMESQFCQQSDIWHEAVCSTLKKMPREMRKVKPEIQRLRILPLSDGTWASSEDATNLFFDLKIAGIPTDLGFRSLKPGIKKSSGRYGLFAELGVKPADIGSIVQRILELHKSYTHGSWTLQSFICHAQFIYANRRLRGLPSFTDLLVADEDCNVSNGSELYMDRPGTRRMRDVLPRPPARFIHLDYLKAYEDGSKKDWLQWLQGSLQVNVSPRLINGDLSPEFAQMARTLDSREFLLVLKESWSQLQGKLTTNAISQLAQTVVVCEDGSSLAINATYIGRTSLRHFDLPFLPIRDPDDREWSFLKHLGVSAEVNGMFFVKRLTQLQQDGCEDDDLITDTYKQLEARFDDDPGEIRKAFQCNPLIFVSHDPKRKRWVRFSDVVWSAPRGIKSKIALKDVYPFFENFFRIKLQVNNPPPQDMLVDEIKAIAMEWGGMVLPDNIKSQVIDILFDISTLLRKNPEPTPPKWLQKLRDERIFPVDSPSKGVMLRNAYTRFYIPDNGKYEQMCRGHIQLLSLERSLVRRIQPLLDSQVFKSRIRYLGGSIEYTSIASGPRFINNAFTEKYACRFKFIKRIVHHAHHSEPSPDIVKHLVGLRNVAIFIVDEIQSTLSIKGFSCTEKDDIAIEEEPTRLSILICKTFPSYKWDLHICSKLEKLLEFSKEKLHNIVLQPIEAVEDMLHLEGVPEIATDPLLDSPPVQDADTIVPASPTTFAGVPDVEANPFFDQSHLQGTDNMSRSSPSKPSQGHQIRGPGPISAVPHSFKANDSRNDLPTTVAAMSGLSIASSRVRSGSFARRDIEELSQFSPSTKRGPMSPSSTKPSHFRKSSSQLTAVHGRGHSPDSNAQYYGIPRANAYERQSGLLSEFSNELPDTAAPMLDTSIASDRLQFRNFIRQDIGELSKFSLPEYLSPVSVLSTKPARSRKSISQLTIAGFSPDGNTQITREIPVTEYEQQNGVLGEYFVYKLLSRDLPDFGPDNWTSELRELIPEFTPYKADALADFKYDDREGVLTSLWYGEEKKEEWRNKWPTYHVEVKSTSGIHEPFHMSGRQLAISLNLTTRGLDSIPKEVYVLIRVSEIRTLVPSLAVYVDPHRYFCDGELQIVTDVDIVEEST